MLSKIATLLGCSVDQIINEIRRISMEKNILAKTNKKLENDNSDLQSIINMRESELRTNKEILKSVLIGNVDSILSAFKNMTIKDVKLTINNGIVDEMEFYAEVSDLFDNDKIIKCNLKFTQVPVEE